MKNEKFNPYNYNQYFNLPKPAPEYDPSRILPPRAGMSSAELEHLRELKRRAEEEGRRQIAWNTRDGTMYPSLRRAIDDAGNIEIRFGLPDCRK